MQPVWPPLLTPDNPSASPRTTLDAWLELGEDEPGEFYVDRIVEEEMADFVHELVVTWIAALLRGWLGKNGFVGGSEAKLVVSPERGRKADVVVFFPGSPPPPRRGPILHAPDLLVEVVTPTPRDERRDRVEKMGEYARFGVRYYWIVDPALGTFEIFERTERGHYQQTAAVTEGRIELVPGCPGLVIDVDELWSELSRLPDEPT